MLDNFLFQCLYFIFSKYVILRNFLSTKNFPNTINLKLKLVTAENFSRLFHEILSLQGKNENRPVRSISSFAPLD